MKTIAGYAGSRRLVDNLRQFERTMTLQEALATPLPDEIEDDLTHDPSDEIEDDGIPVELT